jgi:hypothetical protein
MNPEIIATILAALTSLLGGGLGLDRADSATSSDSAEARGAEEGLFGATGQYVVPVEKGA